MGLRVKIVAFDSDAMAKAYIKQSPVDWPLLLDVERKLYRAYGLPRGNWWEIYNPVSILRYLKLIGSGRRPGRPGSDWRQLGGDVLINPAGIIRFHHAAKSPHDRPDVETVLRIVESNRP